MTWTQPEPKTDAEKQEVVRSVMGTKKPRSFHSVRIEKQPSGKFTVTKKKAPDAADEVSTHDHLNHAYKAAMSDGDQD